MKGFVVNGERYTRKPAKLRGDHTGGKNVMMKDTETTPPRPLRRPSSPELSPVPYQPVSPGHGPSPVDESVPWSTPSRPQLPTNRTRGVDPGTESYTEEVRSMKEEFVAVTKAFKDLEAWVEKRELELELSFTRLQGKLTSQCTINEKQIELMKVQADQLLDLRVSEQDQGKSIRVQNDRIRELEGEVQRLEGKVQESEGRDQQFRERQKVEDEEGYARLAEKESTAKKFEDLY